MNKQMVVEKINKFKRFLKEILKKIRLGVYVLPEVALALASVGCSEAKADVVEEKPTMEQTQVVNTPITNTPTPTPIVTSKPTSTPLPQMTMEQKELLLGINEQAAPITVDRVIVVNYTLNGKKYRNWAYFEEDKEKTEASPTNQIENVYNLFNGEYLFSLSVPNKGFYIDGQTYPISMYKNFLSETNPALNGMQLDLSFGISEVAPLYDVWEVNYNNDPTLTKFGDINENGTPEQRQEVGDTVLTLEDQIQIFLNSTPQEEIMPYWVYTPGAKIPDELKGIYSETEYPPAPALSETTVQQSNRVYNGKAFTSKDGAASINYPFERISNQDVVDNNVPYGYRNPGYYNSSVHTVTAVNHSYQDNQYTKTKI